MGIAAGISAIGSLGAGLMTSSASKDAAQTEADATQQALGFDQSVYDQTRTDLSPYRNSGAAANKLLQQQLPQLSSQFDPTEANLEKTPGYQFDLSQGLKSTQNSAAARGLGVSGAALKGATTYATGLADNTLNSQFNIDQTNKTNAYNKLLGAASLGESAASAGGNVGSSIANTSTNALLTGAQGQASAETAAGTAFNPALNSLGSNYITSQLSASQLQGNNGLANLYYANKSGLFGKSS